jgi:hypothetical protein
MQELAGIKADQNEEFDIDQAFKQSPDEQSYDDMLDIVTQYEDDDDLNSFKSTFPKDQPVNKEKWVEWSRSISDYDPEGYTYLNWISVTDDDIFQKAGIL